MLYFSCTLVLSADLPMVTMSQTAKPRDNILRFGEIVLQPMLTFNIVASLAKILRSYWPNFSHVMLDIIGYLTLRGTIVGHNMSNIIQCPTVKT